jgi:hypothetical protein
MKKLLCLILIAAPLFATAAKAQSDAKEFDVALFANYWDVKDGDDNVWGPGISLAVPLWENQLKLDIRATWLPDAGKDRYGDIALVPLDLGLSWHYNCNEPWDLYALGGASWVFSNQDPNDDLGGSVKLEDDTIGAYVGVGARYDFVDNLGLFTNVYYRFVEFDVKSDNVEGLDESGTFEADGLNVDIGLVYSF